MKRLSRFMWVSSFPLAAFAQEAQPATTSFLTGLITWIPFLFLIVLWWMFMRRMNIYGKGGYREYMRVMQERVEKIETHLGDIASSLRRIADEPPGRDRTGA